MKISKKITVYRFVPGCIYERKQGAIKSICKEEANLVPTDHTIFRRMQRRKNSWIGGQIAPTCPPFAAAAFPPVSESTPLKRIFRPLISSCDTS
jgi:hypothetical protein